MAGKLAIEEAPQPAAEAADPYRPLPTTLCAVAGEISELAQLSDRLQALISAALLADGSTDPDHIKEFQAIDLLVQSLHGVATFLGALADSTSTEWRVDAAAAASDVLLTDLARRLGGVCASADALDQTRPPPTGDLDLFG
jgi:hypothetical protein